VIDNRLHVASICIWLVTCKRFAYARFMREKAPAGRRSGCPINILLEAVGDTWSLLIVRDLMFFGRKTYNEFPNAGEKIATNILSDRLQRLESSVIVAKQRDPSDARRYLYRLTEKGTDLAPVAMPLS
jgi:DNA-binding HxlR family transcriptional regulator